MLGYLPTPWQWPWHPWRLLIIITFIVGDPSYYNLPLLTMVGRGSIPSHRHMQINVVLCLVFATKCMYFFPSSTFLTHSQGLGQKKSETPDIQTSPEQRCGPPRHRLWLFGCLGNRGFLRPKHSRSHSWLITVSHHPILGDFPKPVQWWGGYEPWNLKRGLDMLQNSGVYFPGGDLENVTHSDSLCQQPGLWIYCFVFTGLWVLLYMMLFDVVKTWMRKGLWHQISLLCDIPTLKKITRQDVRQG